MAIFVGKFKALPIPSLFDTGSIRYCMLSIADKLKESFPSLPIPSSTAVGSDLTERTSESIKWTFPFHPTEDAFCENVMSFVGDPVLTSKVCKAFQKHTKESDVYRNSLTSWLREDRTFALRIEAEIRLHPEQFPAMPISLTMASCAALTKPQCEMLVKRFYREFNALKDNNLIRFFDRLSLSIPDESKPVGFPDTIPEKAAAIRSWMSKNQEVLGTIKVLDLENANLEILPPEIGRLFNLRELNLQNNKLKTLCFEFFQLLQLRQLSLSNNPHVEISEGFKQLVNLRSLFLSDNQYEVFPETLSLLVDLEALHLSGNKLAALPEAFNELVNLRELFLSENRFEIWPETLNDLVQLRVLYVAQNRIAVLPETLGNLVNLRELALAGNPLEALPGTFGQLVNLRTLYLNSTLLQTLPATFVDLVSLRTLYLSDAQLRELPENFGQLVNLEVLMLYRNHLIAWPDTFFELVNLEIVDIGNNPIDTPETRSVLRARLPKLSKR